MKNTELDFNLEVLTRLNELAAIQQSFQDYVDKMMLRTLAEASKLDQQEKIGLIFKIKDSFSLQAVQKQIVNGLISLLEV